MKTIDPTELKPRHEVTDPDKANRLAADMRKNGWQGRPVLVWGDKALTGVHRIEAAWQAGIGVPVEAIEGEAAQALADHTDIYGRLGCDDEEVLAILEDVLGADSKAADLMEREIESNLR